MPMETVVIFADADNGADYERLATTQAPVEIVPLAAAASVGERAMGVAVIDSGADAEAGLRHLKEMKENRADVPVIFVTGASSEEVVIRAFKFGARDYFRKPLDVAELGATVGRILALRRETSGHTPLRTEEYAGECPALPHLPDGVPERLLRSVRYMEQNLDKPFSLDNVAQVACLSKYHFCRVFKKHLGSSPFQFLMKLRVCRAGVLLLQRDLSIPSVALRAGFSDLSEFNRQFKRITGVTPTAHRKLTAVSA